jgi:hypothetical protein
MSGSTTGHDSGPGHRLGLGYIGRRWALQRVIDEGAEPEPGTPADQAAVIDHEETKWAAVIQSAHLQPKRVEE